MAKRCQHCGCGVEQAGSGLSGMQESDGSWLYTCEPCFMERNEWARPAVVGSVVTLPARNSKAFKALPLVAQELLHSAHRLQFKLRTQRKTHKDEATGELYYRTQMELAEERARLSSGLLRCLALVEQQVQF